MQITIRKGAIKDVGAITELHRNVVSKVNSTSYPHEVIEEWLSEITEENVRNQFKNSDWIVVEMNSEIIGFGQYSVADGEIYQINVAPNYLNQNVGRRLYDYIENEFRNNGVEIIYLNSTLNAVGFYQKLGFEIVQEINFKSLKMMKMEKLLRTQK